MTAAMTERGEGERRLASRRRRLWTVIGALFLAGLIGGFTLAMVEGEGAPWLNSPLPTGWAIGFAIAWLVVMIGGTYWYKRVTDELDIGLNREALAIGGCAVLIGYPVWWLLWRGGLVDEPSAHIIFLALYAVVMGAYLVKRFR